MRQGALGSRKNFGRVEGAVDLYVCYVRVKKNNRGELEKAEDGERGEF